MYGCCAGSSLVKPASIRRRDADQVMKAVSSRKITRTARRWSKTRRSRRTTQGADGATPPSAPAPWLSVAHRRHSPVTRAALAEQQQVIAALPSSATLPLRSSSGVAAEGAAAVVAAQHVRPARPATTTRPPPSSSPAISVASVPVSLAVVQVAPPSSLNGRAGRAARRRAARRRRAAGRRRTSRS